MEPENIERGRLAALEGRVMETIRRGGMPMRARWVFVARNLATGPGAVLALLFAVFIMSAHLAPLRIGGIVSLFFATCESLAHGPLLAAVFLFALGVVLVSRARGPAPALLVTAVAIAFTFLLGTLPIHRSLLEFGTERNIYAITGFYEAVGAVRGEDDLVPCSALAAARN